MADPGLPQLSGGSVLTVGTFDGIHIGHREILDDLERRAKERGFASLIVTFTPHPLAVVNPAAAPKLLTPGVERLVELAPIAGTAAAVVVPFSPTLASLTAEQFVERLVDRYVMRDLVVGYDHGL